MNIFNFRVVSVIFMTCYLGAGMVHAEPYDHSHKAYSTILKQYVSNGQVDYAGLKRDRDDLDAYLKDSSKVSMSTFQSWTRDQQLTFLINIYNAETLQLIIDHYPLKSVKDIGSLFTKTWDLQVVRLFGKKLTLNNIEQDMIRKNYREPRIHVALVCAAKGCPELLDTAYTQDRLDAQLTKQTQKFLADTKKNHFDVKSNILYLSPIFKWYKEDFNNRKGTVQFARQYANESLAHQLEAEGIRIHYTDYDWSLNDIERK